MPPAKVVVPRLNVLVPETNCCWAMVSVPVRPFVIPAVPEKALFSVKVVPDATCRTPSTAAKATTGTSRLLDPPLLRIPPLVIVSVVGLRPETASIEMASPLRVRAASVCEVGTVFEFAGMAR